MIENRIKNGYAFLAVLQYVVYGSVILYFGRDIFIPLSFSILISFVLYPACRWLEKRGFRRMTAILINIGVLLILFLGLAALLIHQVVAFLQEWPLIQEKVNDAIRSWSLFLTNVFGISTVQQHDWIANLVNQSGTGLWSVLKQTIRTSVFSTVLMILIPVYSILTLYYRELWVSVLLRLFPDERREKIMEILSLTVTAYYNFIKGMGLVYLIVGVLNSIGLSILGVPHAILFGFIASILTFIPYVGIMIGSLLPMTMAWITHGSMWYPLIIVAIFAFVQYLEANVIFPLAVSNRLQVNTLVILVSIFVGGLLWGMAGMILFVPFTGILKLIADHNPKLKTLSIILGTGKTVE